MEITFFCKNVTKKEEKSFTDYVEHKRETIEGLLTQFAKDAKLLKVSLIKFDKHDAYEVEFNLVLPIKSLVAKEASHSIEKAVDLCKDRLMAQIKKYMATLRGARKHHSVRQSHAEVPVSVEEFKFEEVA